MLRSRSGGKMLFVTELSGHGDEGMRNWIKMADRAMAARGHATEVARLKGDPRWSAFLPGTLGLVRHSEPDILVYVPYSGLTSKALVRHLMLRWAAGPRVDVLVALQADPVVRQLPGGPMLGAFASERLRSAHGTIGDHSCLLSPVVNSERFRPADRPRSDIRKELGLAEDKPMVLHVGHLRRSRGLDPLIELATDGSVNVVMVASTATEPEREVESQLRSAGVLVKREFLPEIQRWYQAADVYVFPVTDLQGSIEIPLTVLEAMACGAPVASTPFGGLPSLLASSESLSFAPASQLAVAAKAMLQVDGLSNRSAVVGMSESAFASAMESAIERANGHA